VGRKEGGGTLERKGTEGKKVKGKKWGRDTEGALTEWEVCGRNEGGGGLIRILNPAEGQKNADT